MIMAAKAQKDKEAEDRKREMTTAGKTKVTMKQPVATATPERKITIWRKAKKIWEVEFWI